MKDTVLPQAHDGAAAWPARAPAVPVLRMPGVTARRPAGKLLVLPQSFVSANRGEGVMARSFKGANGSAEHFLVIEAPKTGAGFAAQMEGLYERYEAAQRQLGLAPGSAIFRRIFLSDILNQASLVWDSALVREIAENPVATSMIQQAPLSGAKIGLFAYHIDSPDPFEKEFIGAAPGAETIGPRHMLLKKNGFRHLWSCGPWKDGLKPARLAPGEETRVILEELMRVLGSQGATLAGHCVRTWFFIKNVDVFYQDMVDSRRALFAANGLTKETHYIAATGIEGTAAGRVDTVCMDALSLPDLAPGQVSYLNDFDRLCPANDYGVTFERGTRIAFADRMHYYLSGTASIDHRGSVLHVGDVCKQAARALENMDALLKSGGARLGDMMYLIAYVRDPADYLAVSAYVREALPDVPCIVVQGAVCRPEWLVEFEGVAATPNNQPALASF